MNWDSGSNIAIAVLTVIAATFQFVRTRSGQGDQIKKNLELLALLPEKSKARIPLGSHVDNQIFKLIKDEDELRRDPSGIVLAIILFTLAVMGIVFAVRSGGWWWFLLVPGIFLLILSLVGFAQDVRRMKRDGKGRPLK